MHIFAWLLWTSMDQSKYACFIPGRSPWKLEITVVDTPITMIAASFWGQCQVPALLLSKHRRLPTQQSVL